MYSVLTIIVFYTVHVHFVVASGVGGETSKMQSLAELFKAPFDIMFSGTFQEVRVLSIFLPSLFRFARVSHTFAPS